MTAISEKAIGFRHPDVYDPDRTQMLISSFMSRHLSIRKMSSKSMHVFSGNLANRQTDRQTDRHRGQSHLPPPLSEVIIFPKLIVAVEVAFTFRQGLQVHPSYRSITALWPISKILLAAIMLVLS